MVSLVLAAAFVINLSFQEHTIATDLKGGYQVVPFDVNQDGKTDLIALASGMDELAWFEGPQWTRHVMAKGLNRMINLAACAGMDAGSRNVPARNRAVRTRIDFSGSG